jgi:alpha-beta hydrolase superfamily lysophospholipase
MCVQKCFLLGEGMGAALALRAYINQGLKIWDGMVMISPMLTLPRRFRPKPRFLKLIRCANISQAIR